MKHIFIVNPVAGKGIGKEYVNEISKKAMEMGVDFETHLTEDKLDAEKIARGICEKNESIKKEKNRETLRFYACGGDGTLNEVVNGIHGFKKAELACIPIGSGNDFVKNFPNVDFFDIEKQINGEVQAVDLLEYSGIFSGTFMKKVAINMFNIGFDANVGNDTNHLKKIPFLYGKAPYRIALGTNFIAKRGGNLIVNVDGEEVHNGKLFFVNICNGCFLGGGMKGAPFARVDDGKMDINVVKNVSRLEFLQIVNKYMSGTHMEHKGIEKIITYMQAESIKLFSRKENYRLGVDGEIIQASGELHFRILPKAVDFSIPSN